MILAAAALCASGCGKGSAAPAATGGLRIVAAENFWGSLVAQLAGPRARVVTVVSDPNADPHEYSSSPATARAFAGADYVVENGDGYDSWSDKLMGADGHARQKVLNVADLLGQESGTNPHFWYSPADVNRVVTRMERDLISLDPRHADDYRRRYQTLQASLAKYQDRIQAIRQRFQGTKVAATEDIFLFLGKAAGLDVISPPEFMQAVAEGIDPPVRSVIEFQDQIKSKQPVVLVYNRQTVTRLTARMKEMAAAEDIPIVGITETVEPPQGSFQEWMDGEVAALESALNSKVRLK